MSAVYFSIVALASIYVLTESVIGGLWRVCITSVFKRTPIQNWVTILIYCPACTGFWIGLCLWFFGWADWTHDARNEPMVAGCAGLLLGLALSKLIPLHSFEIEQGGQLGGGENDPQETRHET